jgi:YMGG-like Gly-zipper
MKTKPIIALLAVTSLLTGCVGTGPNTQNGAVAGGAIGALAGAIIGNNSRGHDALGGAVIGGIAGAIAGGTLGNSVDHQNGTIYRSEYEATTNVAVNQVPPPPAPPEEVVTVQPTPSAIWIAGYYAFDGYRYYWVGGHWEIPPPQYHVFVRPHWVVRSGSYVYVRGYWR